jgi:hypothetical protein
MDVFVELEYTHPFQLSHFSFYIINKLSIMMISNKRNLPTWPAFWKMAIFDKEILVLFWDSFPLWWAEDVNLYPI